MKEEMMFGKIVALLSLVLMVCLVTDASAWGRQRNVTVTKNIYSSPAQAAAQKANISASRTTMRHWGGGFGGGRAEGVGCGATAAQALANCCFTGQRACIAASVRQGANGRWYAVKIFR